jgi:hypothetical protein
VTGATALCTWASTAGNLGGFIDGAYVPIIVGLAGVALVYLRRSTIEAKRNV